MKEQILKTRNRRKTWQMMLMQSIFLVYFTFISQLMVKSTTRDKVPSFTF